MTVAAQLPRNQYLANGAQTVFSYTFEIVTAGDIAVYVGTALQTLSTDYTVSGVGNNSGGSVTFVTAPANAAIVTFHRDMSYQRLTDYQQGGAAYASDFNNDSDRNTLQIQQIDEKVERSIRLGPGSQYQGDNLEIAEDAEARKGGVLGFSQTTGNVEIRQDLATEEFVLDRIGSAGGGTVTGVSGSGGTTGLTLTGGPIYTVGTLTLGGTLAVTNGGTGVTTSTGSGSNVLSASPAFTGTPTAPTQTAGDNSTRIASTAFVAAAVNPSVRQTVSAGPVTTAGLPDFLPSTNPGSLAVSSQSVTSSAPFVATAANNWSATTGLPVNLTGYSTSNLSWTGLTASRAAATPNFLYVVINANGSLSTGSTVRAPIYQFGGAPSTTNNQFTFNISEMRGYLGNGTTATQVNRVFVGEAATDGTGVISTIAYAYNGLYESAWTATLPSSGVQVVASHNIGVQPRMADFIMECTTTDKSYPVGRQLRAASLYATNGAQNALATTATLIEFMNGGFLGQSYNTNAVNGFTLASWRYKFIAERRW